MKTLQRVSQTASSRPYATASLIALVRRIVDSSDRAALKELHDHRTVFRLGNGQSMLLAHFIEALARTSWASQLAGGYGRVLEGAYDITVDRYFLLPCDGNGDGHGPSGGLDCRNYYRLFVYQAARWKCSHPDASMPEREAAAAQLLQARVIQDFRFALMEAKRAVNPARTRYAWKVRGGVINLWMPASLPGSKRQEWLAANVGDPDLSRPGEGKRVQEVVDRLLGTARHYCWDARPGAIALRSSDQTPLHCLTQREVSIRGLAATVADEKAMNLDLQRPAVKRLGMDRLRGLILRIFHDLAEDAYEEKELAERFGLSRATFCRFAGSRWRNGSVNGIPDLWANTAQTLANHAHFVEAAEEAGVWRQVRAVLDATGTKPER